MGEALSMEWLKRTFETREEEIVGRGRGHFETGFIIIVFASSSWVTQNLRRLHEKFKCEDSF